MRRFDLVFLPEARDDLDSLYAWIADQSGERVADNFIGRLRSFCFNLTFAPERGRRRDELLPGLRLIGYRRRATIAFTIRADTVVILRIAYRGRDVDALFAPTARP
ncbi:type II toxin-antitoxin system RelE/ParE family toxin [Bosea sp. (in: a-proteobacteria)]|jgi:toxin ParE1/3/4|uniref:type II toxin-antitoxin system RelE/ParE family toxin n=1 Tax=Bosea sp. (in: a-proteobacteria) TaxID=1871050 RepID=UPI0027345E1E|nr:type II toxin-antitoxin system RelE/ParE family toxin [Bosea sp. (in: a-proteobacteria)]MDP3409491.1 type II toxin-antitoxin system RelE/ParE family toxin [Bosea sp. (in: a-proteobacteria)]